MSSRPRRVQALTDFTLALFRTHGALLAWGDDLVEPVGLTSARWQVLGALALGGGALTVPSIARSMGLTRQGIQKQVDLLKSEGLVTTRPNPAHERSPLLMLTAAGKAAFAQADARWVAAAAKLAAGMRLRVLEQSVELLDQLTERLSASKEKE